MLAQRLNAPGLPPSAGEYYGSEKLDGVRLAYDGKGTFWTRGNQRIRAPPSFVSALPQGTPLDGELFAGRGKFHVAQSLYSSPADNTWRALQYRVFDMPGEKVKPYREVYQTLRRMFPPCAEDGVVSAGGPRACAVEQIPMHSNGNVRDLFSRYIRDKAEGIILRRANARYTGGRTGVMLKLKQVREAEAMVMEILPGKGKYSSVMGKLLVRWPGGGNITFKVGTGFSDMQRAHAARLFPPGTLITVKYMELEASGRPRHPVFLAIRRDL
jgi:DNA ligase 1